MSTAPPSTTHYLKTWKTFFSAIIAGGKRFEIRLNDRNFMLGDILVLREYDTQLCDFTGRDSIHRVTYIFHGPGFGLHEGFCCMSLEPIFFI